MHLLSPLVSLDETDAEHGLALYQQHSSIGAFDAVLAATVIHREHLTALVSADNGFAGIERLAFANLADVDAVEALVNR